MIHIHPVNPTGYIPDPRRLQEELRDSIRENRLADVQRILAFCNQNGAMIVNLNGQYGNASSALMWALWWTPVNLEIIDSLLQCRDNQGNLQVDLNREGPQGQTIFSFLLSDNFSPEQRQGLLQKFLDVRGPRGELLADLTADRANVALLEKAIWVHDVECLRMLLNVRREDGRSVLDPNEIRFGSTLHQKIERSSAYDEKLRNLLPEVRRIMREAAARHRPRPQWAPNAFEQNSQNTHDPSVTQTATGSLRSLENIYPDASSNESAVFSEVETLLSTFNYDQLLVRSGCSSHDKKKLAESSWNLIKESLRQIHTYTGFSISKILCLIWSAIKDDRMEVCTDELKSVFGHQVKHVPAHFLELKRASFIEKLIEAKSTYSGDGWLNICTGGLIHKLLETLNKAHSAVVICMSDQAVMSAANEVPAYVAKRELIAKSVSEQRSIFGSWSCDGETLASAFRNQIIASVRDELTRRFGTLLPEEKKEEICASIEFLRRPLLHQGLVELLETIDAMPPTELHRPLKERAQNLSAEGESWFEEEYHLLLSGDQ